MAVETISVDSNITLLNDLWPLISDPMSEGDNHIRLIKTLLLRFYVEFEALSKSDVGLANVANYGTTTVIKAASESVYVLPSAVRAVFGVVKQTATFTSLEEAMGSLSAGSLVSRAEQVGTGGPWRVYYYELSL